MKFKHGLIILSIFTITACTSATRSSLTTLPATNTQISPVLAAAPQKSLKRLVAVGRFSDETKRGNSFLTDTNNNRLGKQASDILAARLTDSEKFIVLERSDLSSIDNEGPASKQKNTILSANYIILGSVSEYGRSTKSEVGVFSRNKIQQANVTVNVRLVNVKTSEVVYSEEATGEATVEANRVFGVGESAGYDSSLDDKALSAAISKLVSNIMENLMDSPWQAFLVEGENGQMFMTGGKSQGVKLADKFQVSTLGKQVKNPQTGKLLILPGTKVATLSVVGFVGEGENELSMTKLDSGKIDPTKVANYVITEL